MHIFVMFFLNFISSSPLLFSLFFASNCKQDHKQLYYADDKIKYCQEVSLVNWIDVLISFTA